MEVQQNLESEVFDIVFNGDDLTWKEILLDLVKREGMDPWNLDISQISQKFLEMLNKLREMDFILSGKVVLAAALLLKIKSDKLMDEDIVAFDTLLSEEPEDFEMFDMLQTNMHEEQKEETPKIVPKIPQPRKRKVSVQDLVKALEKALETKNRRKMNEIPEFKVQVPKKGRDISLIMGDIYKQIIDIIKPGKQLTFTELLPSDDKEDKVYTFIPLLHLENARKINMSQEKHFGEININLLDNSGLAEFKKD
jgi:segregation and condensation protein A